MPYKHLMENINQKNQRKIKNKSERTSWDYVKDSLTIIIQIWSIFLPLLTGLGFYIIWFYINNNSFVKPIIDISSTTFLFFGILFASFYFFFSISGILATIWIIHFLKQKKSKNPISKDTPKNDHYKILYISSGILFFLIILYIIFISKYSTISILILYFLVVSSLFIFSFWKFKEAGEERKNKPSFFEIFYLALIFAVVFIYLPIAILIFFGGGANKPVDYFMVEIGMRSTPDTLIYITDDEYKNLSENIFLLSAQINSRKISEPDGTVFWYLPQSLILWHDSTNYTLSVYVNDKNDKNFTITISIPRRSVTMIPSSPSAKTCSNPPGKTTKNLENQEKPGTGTAEAGNNAALKTDELAILKNDSGMINNLSGVTSSKIDIFNNAVIHENNTEIFENKPTPLKKENNSHIHYRHIYRKYYPSHGNSAAQSSPPATAKPSPSPGTAPDKGKSSC